MECQSDLHGIGIYCTIVGGDPVCVTAVIRKPPVIIASLWPALQLIMVPCFLLADFAADFGIAFLLADFAADLHCTSLGQCLANLSCSGPKGHELRTVKGNQT